jgi:hypothetical protein
MPKYMVDSSSLHFQLKIRDSSHPGEVQGYLHHVPHQSSPLHVPCLGGTHGPPDINLLPHHQLSRFDF